MTTTTAQSSSPALLFEEDTDAAVTEVIVHPLVLLHVLDHHTRRQEANGRVIGTLLGRRDGKTVEVTNCFAVPHAERGDEVAIGKDFNKTMLALHLRTNRKEVVVGWYASAASGEDTPALIADTSSLIHDFYSGEADEGDPVHLVVDTRLLGDKLAIQAYKSTPVLVQGEPMGNLFHELRLSMASNESETICLHEMIGADAEGENNGGGKDSPKQEKDSTAALQVSMEKLYTLLEDTLTYVDSVVQGKVEPDAEVGRQIADTMATVPRIRPEVFDRLFQDSLQDLLMVTYLSNITRTQLTIAEKLNASLGV
jgi:translation initiation factor 3 subunit F